MNQTQPSTIEENQNEKSKKDEQRVLPTIRSRRHQKNSGRPHTPMRNKNSFKISFDQQSLKRTTERQHLMNRKIKIKGSLLSKDQDQVEVTTEEAEEITVKITESSNRERTEAEHLLGQPHKTTLTKTTVGKKGAQNKNIQKPEHTIDFPVLQTDSLRFDYLTSSNCPTTPSTMARPNQSNGSGFTHNRLNQPGEMMTSKPCSFPWSQKPCRFNGLTN